MNLAKSFVRIFTALVVLVTTAILIAVIARDLLGAPSSIDEQTPERLLPLPSISEPTTADDPIEIIESSSIVSIKIPAIGVAAKASGPIVPEATERCKESEKCMDPPLLDQIAWSKHYGTPASPSNSAVLIYGHSNASSQTAQVFNNLGALVKSDKIILTTETGRFTYTLDRNPLLVPFEEIPWKQSLYEDIPGRLVAFTCNLSGGGYDKAAVVTARLTSAQSL